MKMFCLECGEEIDMWQKTCHHCGAKQFGENDEYYPDAKSMRKAKWEMFWMHASEENCKEEFFSDEEVFSDEEKLALGLYPDDEGMQMGLISKILGRKGR